MRHLENLASQISITIPPDEDGLIGRECPVPECESYFKIQLGTGLKGENLPCHCPYCGHEAGQDKFFTKAQIEYAQSVVLNKVTGALLKDLKSLEFDHRPRGAFGIGISMKVSGQPTPIRYYREKQLETEVVCDQCTLRYMIYGVFGFCPDCGVHNSLQILKTNLQLVEKMLGVAESQEQAVALSLIENSLEDCVSAFDGFGRETCRVFCSRAGLVVDYLGLADELKEALVTYTESGGTGKTAIDQAEAVALMLEKYEICCGLFHGFIWSHWTTGSPQERLSLLPAAQEHILAQDDGKARLLRSVTELSQAFALAVPHGEAIRIRDDVAFFQAVRSVLAKSTPGERKTDEELEHAIRQIISKAVVSDEVVDIFTAAGLKKPDISILSDEFLAEVQGMPQRNLAVELLRKLLAGEVKSRSRRNVVQARSFAELLEKSIRKYQNRAIETVQVIEELIALAKDLRAADARGEVLGLSEDELAFYDALEVNDSAVKILGEPTLKTIARELVDTVKKNVTIDWTMRENVRAQLRVIVKRILRKYGYPPDKQEKATQTVLEQAELLSGEWAT